MKDLVKQKQKFLIFGHHKVMLDALSKCLNNLNVKFVRIDGSTRNDLRATYIDEFQKNKSCQVAVLSLQGTIIPTVCLNKFFERHQVLPFIHSNVPNRFSFLRSMQCCYHTDCSIFGDFCRARLESKRK